MEVFKYDADLVARYPDVVGGMVLVTGLQNGPTASELLSEYQQEQTAVKARAGNSLSELPSIAAWRLAFRKFGVDPTRYRCAAEALLRRLTKKGDIPSINTLVDIGNLISIRYGLPVAVVDRRGFEQTICVHFASGDELYTELGQTETDPPQPGEVIFSDVQRQVIARRWCWRQSASSGAVVDTTDVLVTIEAHHAEGQRDVGAAVADLSALLSRFAGGRRAVLY